MKPGEGSKKTVLICKSDSTGGAAIVTRRLTEALIRQGVDASMLVLEKRSDAPFVTEARYPILYPAAFLAERLQIFLNNGFSRRNLFKVDTAAFGLPLWRHPLVEEADTVILNWVNQSMLSLEGVKRILKKGKRVIWTMHDMWNMTGICHHAMNCTRFIEKCGCCPYLKGKPGDLSEKVWRRKKMLYDEGGFTFVAVSRWLAGRAEASGLLGGRNVEVIANPFEAVKPSGESAEKAPSDNVRILFAAAGIDNWIKGLPTFRKVAQKFRDEWPEEAENCEILFLGGVKNPESIEGFPLPTRYLGTANGDDELAAIYRDADIIVNSSHFENLPGTLVEGQAYGAVPVAFDRGGQSDIITHLEDGYLARWDDDEERRAMNMAEGLAWAVGRLKNDKAALMQKMKDKVEKKFSYEVIAKKYMNIL